MLQGFVNKSICIAFWVELKNSSLDEVEYLTEEIIEESPTFYLDDIILNDYFDEEILELLKDVYIIGES